MIKIEVNKRIKDLRKNILKDEKNKKYSQSDFGNLLGVSRSVINNIEYELVEAKDHMIKLICQTFNVNEEWLRNGVEPIFIDENAKNTINSLELLQKQYNLSNYDIVFIKNFITLNNSTKKELIKFIKNCIKDIK